MRTPLLLVPPLFAGAVIAGSCGARTELEAPDQGTGGAALVCPTWKTCKTPPSDCAACVNAHLMECGKISDCDPGPGDCSGDLQNHHACRVWAVETVSCMLACPLETCDDTYFPGRGPILPLGLAFNDYVCSVCKRCADVCSDTPNFQLVCNPK